jgi:disulfide bond formation protein DsbB
VKISKFKIYHIILVIVFILALIFLKYDQNLYRNIFYIILIMSLIVKSIYDYIKKSKLDKQKFH